VHQVRQLTVPRTDQLKRSIDQLEALDAAALLKVAPGSDREVLRDAYHRMIKIYHPDRFAGVELPQEVRDYLAAVARRLNIAHAMLQAGTRGEAKVAQPAE
jgi:DnaJ-domain-containing protein 1